MSKRTVDLRLIRKKYVRTMCINSEKKDEDTENQKRELMYKERKEIYDLLLCVEI